MTRPMLGIVSNCWKYQLESGQSLRSLIAQAKQQGFRAIELRQGCLGEFEPVLTQSPGTRAAWENLAELGQEFPDLTLNLAINVPCFRGGGLTDDPSFLAGLAAASALTASGTMHLRLVDTQTRVPILDDSTCDRAATAIAELAERTAAMGGRLSIENAYQSWETFWNILRAAQARLPTFIPRLKCCLDPCNLLLTEAPEGIENRVTSVPPIDIAMIHLKQQRHGQIQPDVKDGDVDWKRLIAKFAARSYHGPWLFEVAPHVEVWQNLDESLQVLFGSEELNRDPGDRHV